MLVWNSQIIFSVYLRFISSSVFPCFSLPQTDIHALNKQLPRRCFLFCENYIYIRNFQAAFIKAWMPMVFGWLEIEVSVDEVEYVFILADKDGDGNLQLDEMRLAIAVWYCKIPQEKSSLCTILWWSEAFPWNKNAKAKLDDIAGRETESRVAQFRLLRIDRKSDFWEVVQRPLYPS